MSNLVVRDVEGEGAVLVLGAILEHVQRELAEFVELELQLVEVVQVDEALGVDGLDGVVRQDQGDQVGQVPEGVGFNPSYLRENELLFNTISSMYVCSN